MLENTCFLYSFLAYYLYQLPGAFRFLSYRPLLMKTFKALIVDDEWLVRTELHMMLKEFPEITMVAEAADVPEALQAIHEHQPDVIFLDVQLSGESGFELLDKMNTPIRIVFITAFDQYAIRAFEVNALDYLLKPIRRERLANAIERLQTGTTAALPSARKLEYKDLLYVVIDGSLHMIKLPLLKCITAVGNYSNIHYSDTAKRLVSKTLQDWEDILPEKYFVRIHRSTIINYEFVERVQKQKNYTHVVFLKGLPEALVMSRRYAVKLRKLMSW
jgi:two-component system, LytTR family, response regulator